MGMKTWQLSCDAGMECIGHSNNSWRARTDTTIHWELKGSWRASWKVNIIVIENRRSDIPLFLKELCLLCLFFADVLMLGRPYSLKITFRFVALQFINSCHWNIHMNSVDACWHAYHSKSIYLFHNDYKETLLCSIFN